MRTRLLRERVLSRAPFLLAGVFIVGIFLLSGVFFSSLPVSNTIPLSSDCSPILHDSRIPSLAFAWLPPLPDCFSVVRAAYYDGTIPSSKIISSKYYLQPEFYPNFESDGVASWITPSATHYGALGLSAFRSNSIPTTLSRTNSTTFRFFVHSSFGIRAYQGVRLSPRVSDENYSHFVSVRVDDPSASGLVFGPSFLKIHPAWAYPVDVTVSVSSGAPSGSVPITVDIVPLPNDFVQPSWIPTEALFFDATSYLGSRPIFSVVADLP